MSQRINLNGPRSAFVDDFDYELIAQFSWRAKSFGGKIYAVRQDGKKMVFMHRQILDLDHGNKSKTDHINGDTLDNRRANLRPCSHAENMRNRKKYASASSKFKGVSWNKRQQKWEANLYFDNHRMFLGVFANEIAAAQRYDLAALKYHGKFAQLNLSTH